MKTALIIFAVFLVNLLVWHFLTRKYINPYKQILYIGVKGTGKTTTEVKLIKKCLDKGLPVYTDATDIRLPGLRVIKISDLGSHYAPNSVFFIDELAQYFGNRGYLDKEYRQRSEEFLTWLRGVRHDRCTVYMFSQDYKVDAQIRSQCDRICILYKFFRVLTVGRMLSKDTVIKDTASDADSQIAQQLKFEPLWVRGSLEFTYIPKYVKLFDSYKNLQPNRPPMPYRLVMPDFSISDEVHYWGEEERLK